MPQVVFLLASPFVGSFIGSVVDRLPRGEPVGLARSVCRSCGGTLGWFDLVPLVSWSLLRGRCRVCSRPIGPFYPAVEVAALLVAVSTLVAMPDADPWRLAASASLGWTLLAIGWIDWRHWLVPDRLSLPLIAGGPLFVWYSAPPSLLDHLAGALAGFVAFALLGWIYERLRGRPGLGLGDAKLLAAGGAWTGWQALPTVIGLAGVIGLGFALALSRRDGGLRRDTAIPFAPALCLAIWTTWLVGHLEWTGPLEAGG